MLYPSDLLNEVPRLPWQRTCRGEHCWMEGHVMITPRRIALSLALLFPLCAPSHEAAPPAEEEFDTDVVADEGAVYGRLRHLEGGLILRRGDEILEEVGVNEAIVPGDLVRTRSDARAEIQLADGTILRLDRDTELVLQTLPDGRGIENGTILQLASGSVILQAVALESAEKKFQIDTDDASIFLLSDGTFRIDADPGLTTVLSRRGSAEVMALEASAMLRSGERVTVRAGEMPGEPRVMNTRSGDDFDTWAAARDEALVHPEAAAGSEVPVEALPEPVRPYATELSFYGSWGNYPTYGWAWRPAGCPVGWNPYLYGRWTWAPGGMVWASYDPWGWAPYHYGRWEFAGGAGWLWIPGFAFAGAHVAWSVSPGYYGWCPLGYYNTPVYYGRVAHHRNPWVYVPAGHIYARHANTVMVRDDSMLRSIQDRAVVMRGRPHIPPSRAADGPAFTRELHRTAASRPEMQIREASIEGRTPFREQERRAMRLHPRANAPRRTAATNPGMGRSKIIPVDPTTSVPRPRLITTRAPTSVTQARPVERQPVAGSPGSQGKDTATTPRTPRIIRGTVPRMPGRSVQPQAPAPGNPPAQPQGRTAQARPQGASPPAAQPQAGRTARSGSAPERMIPRIIPRTPSVMRQGSSSHSSGGPARSASPAPRSQAPQKAAPSGQAKGKSSPAAGKARGHGNGNKDKS